MTVAVITGPSRGIGRATALLLAQRGADLALLGRPSAALQETTDQARAIGSKVVLVPCDLTAPAEIESAARQCARRARRARRGGPQRRSDPPSDDRRNFDPEAYDEQLAVNLRAPFLLTRGAAAGDAQRRTRPDRLREQHFGDPGVPRTPPPTARASGASSV